jgi:hypothetical protein
MPERESGLKVSRHNVVDIFMTNEPLTGKHYVLVMELRTKRDWDIFVKRIADEWNPDTKK